MSRRFWRGFCLAPWLFASTGCATVPFSGSASTTPLPTERKLAIAQTFERQGHTDRARKVYEQILAAEPNSVAAAKRLETLIASGRSGQHQKTATPASSVA